MTGLYNCIEDDVVALFNATWNHDADILVLWRVNDLEPLPDPSTTRYFLRNTVLFGAETYLAFGSGRGHNQKCHFGMVEFVGFAARSEVSERQLLDLLWDATETLRSKRVVGSFTGGSDLSFVGPGSAFDVSPTESGNWFMRGVRVAYEYRFVA